MANETLSNGTDHAGTPVPAAASPAFDRIMAAVVWLGAIVVGGYHLGLETISIGLHEPMGAWETTYVAIARAWPEQYQWSHYIAGHDGYGPGYPFFVRPFLHAGLDIYVAHRLANLIALGLACALLARLLWRRGTSPRATVAITVIFYALNAGTYSIQARPDFLVLLEITTMFALGAAVVRKELTLGWGLGVLFGLLALAGAFTKAYAVFTWGAVLAYVAVFVNFRDAVRAALIGAAILAAGIGAYAARNPLYAMEVFRGPLVQAAPSFRWLVQQGADFGWLAVGLVAATLVPLIARARSRLRRDNHTPAPTPTAEGRYWLTQGLVAMICLVAGPGWHTGAYLTYFLHLPLVPLAMAAGSFAAEAPTSRSRWFDLALLANCAVLMLAAPSWPRADPGWDELRDDVRRASGRVAVDSIMEPLARERTNIAVVGTGNTAYFLKEPFLIAGDSLVLQHARAAALRYSEDQPRDLFHNRPVDTIYLDCIVLDSGRAGQARFAAIPRNELPFFTGPEMRAYVPEKTFEIRPYYFATNAPRQEAGAITTTIVKFTRKK